MAARKSSKEKKTEERRKQILEAAIDVFSRKGFAAATVPEIAEAAGVAAGTIYIYFPSKRELFMDALKNLIFTTPLLDLISKVPTGNIEDVVQKIFIDRFELIKNENSVITRMPTLIGEILRDPELKELWLKDFLHPFFKRMELLYGMFRITGKVRNVDPKVMVRNIGGLILGFLIIRIMEGESSPVVKLGEEKVAKDLSQILLYGLLNDDSRKKNKKEGKK